MIFILLNGNCTWKMWKMKKFYYYYEHDKTLYILHWISFLTGWITPFKRHRYSMLFSTIISYVSRIVFIHLWSTLWRSVRIQYWTQQAYHVILVTKLRRWIITNNKLVSNLFKESGLQISIDRFRVKCTT